MSVMIDLVSLAEIARRTRYNYVTVQRWWREKKMPPPDFQDPPRVYWLWEDTLVPWLHQTGRQEAILPADEWGSLKASNHDED